MLDDPTPLLVLPLRSMASGTFVSGDWIGRPEGRPTVIVEYDGGYRVVRDRMDRAEFTIHVYAGTRAVTAALAFNLRARVLADLPGAVVNGIQIADVDELMMPTPTPDEESREWRFTFSCALYVYEL